MKKHTIIPYSLDGIEDLLRRQAGPIMESTLFSSLAREQDYPRLSRKYLFEFHFSLYHALYRIKISSTLNYLHIDPMRIRLVKLPLAGECGFYDEKRGNFCREKTSEPFCSFHSSLSDISYPVVDVMKGFYLDPHNIEFGKTCNLEKCMHTLLSYGLHKRDIDDALAFFNVPYLDWNIIQKRYKEFALKNHPDRQGSTDMMKEANRNYAILKILF